MCVGDRAVPLLATPFYLSYMKLFCLVVTVFGFMQLSHYPDGSKYTVWILDGNLPYCQHPHIYLFITSIAIIVILYISFTLFLLLIRFWIRISSLWPLRWITNWLLSMMPAFLHKMMTTATYSEQCYQVKECVWLFNTDIRFKLPTDNKSAAALRHYNCNASTRCFVL